jgi:hypothetical protein
MLVGLGWLLGYHWTEVNRYATHLQYGIVAAIAVALGWQLWRRKRVRHVSRKVQLK